MLRRLELQLQLRLRLPLRQWLGSRVRLPEAKPELSLQPCSAKSLLLLLEYLGAKCCTLQMEHGAKHFFRRKKSCTLGAPLGEIWRSPNYRALSLIFQTFSNLGKILRCFLMCSFHSKMSLNITNSYFNDIRC